MCPYKSIIFANVFDKKKERMNKNNKKENLNINKKQSYTLKFFKRVSSNLGKVVQDRGSRVTDT